MNKNTIRLISIFEIILMISLSVSFSYILNDSSKGLEIAQDNSRSNLLGEALALIGKIIFPDNSVEAQSTNVQVSDATNGAYTCLLSKDNEYCKQYPSSSCDSQCTTACIKLPLSEVNECHGTCYNPINGVCSSNSPKALCPNNWFNDKNGNVNECRLGCCIFGQKTSLITEQECNYLSAGIGIKKDFRADVTNVISCLALENTQVSGACLYGDDRQCRFVTKQECQNSIHGQFFENTLCSNPNLNTSCERQASTGCVQGRDEVYWFDSCGNRENIFGIPRTGSWNNGFVLSKEQSCSIGSDGKVNCGNCNFLQGSVCGRASSKSEVSVGDYVCKDLSCTDENGKKRDNLESWCSYQGSVGVDGNRASDTVGSRDFRNTCVRGQIVQDACADFRNEICVESKTNFGNGKQFSTAACRINRWQECINYNTLDDKKKGIDLCNKNVDCFVKSVKISDKFNFDLCTPKYAPGFSLDENGRGDGAESICSLGNQKCTYVKVKGLFSDDEYNKECLTNKFTEQMNDFCMSLGDCGAKSNYLGDVSESYAVSNAPLLSPSYLSNIIKYADEKLFKGKVAEPGNIVDFYESLGIPQGIGSANPGDPSKGPLQASAMVQQYSSIAGLGLMLAGTKAGLVVVNAISPSIAPALGAAGGALAGAAAGLALTGWLLGATGVGRGLPEGVTYGLMAVGAVGGALAGIAFASGAAAATAAGTGAIAGGFAGLLGTSAAAAAPLGPIGLIIIVIVVIVILVLKLLGVGKVTKIDVTFKCLPWQAKPGGNACNKCGSDGFPCSRYACQSLGQTCQIINENTNEPECVDVNPGDVNAPDIKPLSELISNLDRYTDISADGFKIKGQSECLEPFDNLVFGIKLNEAGQCKFDIKHTNSFAEMEDVFTHTSLYKQNHTLQLRVPSLAELGADEYSANASTDFNIYARCQDKRGNVNAKEFVISMCVNKGIDVTAPVIVWKVPNAEVFAWNATSQNINLYTNEPAECKWDKSNIEYEKMVNQMQCANDFSDRGIYGWKCNADFPIQDKKNNYYVKCKDQPSLIDRKVYIYQINDTNRFLTDEQKSLKLELVNGRNYLRDGYVAFQDVSIDEVTMRKYIQAGYDIGLSDIVQEAKLTNLIVNGSKAIQTRNVNVQSYNLSLLKSESVLKIDDLKPNGTLVYGNAPASVLLEVKTSGGVNGRATCKYSLHSDYLPFSGDSFIPPGQSYHKANLQLFEGLHDVEVSCKDEAGNSADKISHFTVKIDSEAPKITRTYVKNNVLNVITDEDAKCSYVLENNCGDAFTNGTSMGGDNSKIHSTQYNAGKTYYVSCKDKFERSLGSECSAIITPGKIS